MRPLWVSLLLSMFAVGLWAQDASPSGPLTLSSGLELSQPRPDASPEELEIYSAYEEARLLEAEIVQMFREIRAAELTQVQRQTLKRSLESVLMPLSDRAIVDREVLTGAVTSAEQVQRYQAELAVVMRETDAILANAEELLKSLLPEAKPESSEAKEPKEEAVPKEATEPQEQQELSAEAQEKMKQAEQASKEAKEAREKATKEAREKKEKTAKEALENTEFHLEKALEEIKAAREEVAREKKPAEEAVKKKEAEAKAAEASEEAKEPEKAKEAKEAREKLEQLEALEAKIDEAEVKVEAVAEKVKAMGDVSKVEVAEAEAALEALREAMASVKAADATAEKSSKETAKEKTAEAVRQMEAASSSLSEAANAIKSLKEESSDGDGGGGGDKIARIQAMGELAQAGSGRWLDLTKQMRGEDLTRTPSETPLEDRPELWASEEELERSPTARIFRADTPKDTWIFIGDWYVLSRYDNTGRVNIQKVYPPESIVDLNAQYLSEDGLPLRWEYESYQPPMVAPYAWESWKIYYFYTELMFETETEAWIAIGSDDRSDLWINDLPVWHSANRHKGWHPAEGFRKVVFEEGRNKILLRLENGQSSLGFSLFLNLPGD